MNPDKYVSILIATAGLCFGGGAATGYLLTSPPLEAKYSRWSDPQSVKIGWENGLVQYQTNLVTGELKVKNITP